VTAYYNEFDPFKAEWLRNLISEGHIAPGDVDDRSIRDVQADELRGYRQCHFFAGVGVWSYALRLSGWSDQREVWTGSCPCQPFSVAGAKRGTDDERHLWPEFFRLIRERCPVCVVGEQVASPDALAWFDVVSADLEGAGYAVGQADLCSASVGGSDRRQRLYWLANAGCTPGCAEQLDEPWQGLRWEAAEDDGTRAGERGEASRLAHSTPGGQRIDGGAPGNAGHASQRRPACGMANPNGREPSDGELQRGGRLLQLTPNPIAGFWGNAEWIKCRPELPKYPEGRWRPVEPGTFPLAYGATTRLGRLRAYGDAINAQVAKAFIEAVMECLP
jgi:DNA (cytosine-5)-methyltransferase 1